MAKIAKIEKLFNSLVTGENVPVSTLERKTGLRNLSAAVNTLRSEGTRIYLNRVKRGNKKVNCYRMAI